MKRVYNKAMCHKWHLSTIWEVKIIILKDIYDRLDYTASIMEEQLSDVRKRLNKRRAYNESLLKMQ